MPQGGIRRSIVLGLLTLCTACAAPAPVAYNQPVPYAPPQTAYVHPAPVYGRAITPVNLKSLPQTIGLEYQDRVNRLGRLASLYGIAPPRIDQLQLPAGQISGINYGIPVIRLQFQERVFFDSGQDFVRPEAGPVLDLLAANMKKDVPDAQATILGHTDAVGSDAYNVDLSKRRALTVWRELVRRGVRPGQLSMVAIGKRQPVADNATEDGRALNRRVEFMISASEAANLALVEQRRIIKEYLAEAPGSEQDTSHRSLDVVVFRANLLPVAPGVHQVPDRTDTAVTKPLPVAPQIPASPPSPTEPGTGDKALPPAAPAMRLAVEDVKSITLQQPESRKVTINKPDEVHVNPLDYDFKPFSDQSAS